MSSELAKFFEEIKKNNKRYKTTPKIIVEKYGVGRRGWRVIDAVNKLLEKQELTIEPEFGNAYFYGEVEICPKPTIQVNGNVKNPKYPDPIPRLGILKSSNFKLDTGQKGPGLVYVKKETSIIEAVSLMIKHNFSQLPILLSKRESIGLISWKTIGKAMSLGKKCQTVMDCYEDATTLKIDEPLFNAVKVILREEVVLVRDNTNEISGIITATDVGEQFLILSEPFLIIEQIENLIRRVLDGKLTLDDINKVLDIEKYEKEIKHLSDLSFGHYVRIVENPTLFEKLNLKVDRVLFKMMLEETNKIRNEVMHFSPEALTPEDILTLRQTLGFINEIVKCI